MTVDPGASRDVDLVRGRVHTAAATYGRRPGPPRRPTLGDRVRDFVRRYGWRAYALPILAVLTVAALMTTSTSSSPSAPAAGPAAPASATPPTAGAHIPLKDDDKGAFSSGVLRAAALPAGPAYTKDGTGTFRVLPGTTPRIGKTGKLFRYTIEVENGVTGVDLAQYAKLVDTTMADPRSWAGHGVEVQRVDSGPVNFRVSLTSSMTVRRICGYDIPVETSCYAAASPATGNQNRVIYNVARWVRGAPAYIGDLNAYRVYMINHENGHALGHNHSHQCLPGGLAPVMMQQTFGLRETRNGNELCAANPWPYPVGVTGAPGPEQLDTAQNNEYGRGD